MAALPTQIPQNQFDQALASKLKTVEVSPLPVPDPILKRDLAYWAYNFAYSQFSPTDCASQEAALADANSQLAAQQTALNNEKAKNAQLQRDLDAANARADQNAQASSSLVTANAKIGSLTTALNAALPALQFYSQSSLYTNLTSLLSPALFGDKGAQARAAAVTVQAVL